MPQISILSPHLADLIAAGEVVERPASVVKELIENAFDAGAEHVIVSIRDGGATEICVTDDGCGMAPEDAGIAFLRHATSKLRDEQGLEAIRTMGFRGEALAAISAVSRIELTTRRPEDAEGSFLRLLAGEIQEMESVGCPSGTEISVRDLFYNTPARLKFLKSDRSEASACIQAGLRCALGRPDISVRFLRDSREEFFTPGDGDPASCCYALLGRELTADFLPLRSSDGDLCLHGFVSSPAAGRGNRSAQFFFVNGRFIKSALLQSALEQAYRNTLLTGRYPACVVWLEIRPGAVDVNVHPAKTEIKFSEERRVFSLLHQAVLAALQQEDRVGLSETAPAVPELPSPPGVSGFSDETVSVSSDPAAFPSTPPQPERLQHSFFESGSVPYTLRPQPVHTSGSAPVENPVQNVDNSPVPDHKILGEAFKTYLLVEVDGELLLIDKHAAHERMNFDRLKATQQPLLSQQLLLPQTLRLSGEDRELLERFGDLFERFGYEWEPFGEDAVILRAVPEDIFPSDALPSLEEILELLKSGGSPDPDSARDALLHTVACKAAIKAGWNTGVAEQERIVQEVLSGHIKYCPHGRPVSVSFTRRELEKLFLRTV